MTKKTRSEWLEDIPKNWSELPLKALLIESKEKNNPIKTDFILSVTKNRGVIPYSEKGQIGNNKSEDIKRYKIVEPNDLVVNKMNIVIGSLGISKYGGALSQVYLIFRPRSSVNIRYYEYVFRNPQFYKFTRKYTTGIMELRESLNDLYFKNTYLPVPPQIEQEKISNYLDDIITKVDIESMETKKLLDRITELKKTRTSELLSKYAEISIKLKYLVKRPLQYGANESGITYSLDLPRYIRITDIDEEGYLRDKGKQSLDYNAANGYTLEKNDILLARSGGTVGKSFIFNENYKAAFAGYLIRVSIDDKILLPKLFYYFTKSSMYDIWKCNILNKSTIENIGASKYAELKVPVPTISEQYKILEILERQDNDFKLLSKIYSRKIELLDEYKKVLINDAVTGKIKIGDEYVK